MKLSGVVLVLLLGGCAGQAVSQDAPPAAPIVVTGGSGTQRLTVRLTLSAPEDLKVKEGDRVSQGQMLSDRVRDRQRLEAQMQQLRLQQGQLSQPVPGAPPARSVPEVAALPPPSFLSQVAEVDRKRLAIEAAQRHLEQQQRKLDLLATIPDAELPEATVPHETELLEQRRRELDQANADLQLAEAQLAKAQSDRLHQEYLHSLELSKRAIALEQAELQRREQVLTAQQQERDRAFQLAQLEAQVQALETQLFALSAVRSPYTGTIQRIKYEGQTDQSLVVELTLVVGGSDAAPRPGAGGAAPAGGARGDRAVR